VPGVITGKPVRLGGSRGRREATGRGIQFCVREAVKHLKMDLKNCRVAVQGFGNVGSIGAELIAQDGAKIVAVSDIKGAIHNPAGLDMPALLDYLKKTGSVLGFPGAQPLNTSIIEYDCDILIPAALENQITVENAGRVKARVIAEGANGPTMHEADAILNAAGKFVIPDILANSGGVTVSYFEWVQNNQGFYWTEKEVNERLEQYMVKAFHDVLEVSLESKVSMRVAAFMLAIRRVIEVVKLRGVYA
jgi:glutamate dehydrogenase/leucine dehydrogenase